MSNIRIVLADTDEKYLMPIERKFIEEFGEQAEIIVITDESYLKQFFEIPQSLDMLIITEDLYNQSIERHDIANIYILTEQVVEEDAENQYTNRIYKYTSVKEIYSAVTNRNTIKHEVANFSEMTKVISVYSPIGGIGKSTVAVGLCAALAKRHKKVLFVCTDNLQTSGYYMHNKTTLGAGIEKRMAVMSEEIYYEIKPYIVSEIFDIIPPFSRALSSLNIKGECYCNLLDKIKKVVEYDYVIVDIASNFSEDTARLMSMADSNLILVGQDRYSAHKLDCLLQNIDCSDKDKFLFACNKYKEDRPNVLVSDLFINRIKISEYIEYDVAIEEMSSDELGMLKSLQKLSYTYI